MLRRQTPVGPDAVGWYAAARRSERGTGGRVWFGGRCARLGVPRAEVGRARLDPQRLPGSAHAPRSNGQHTHVASGSPPRRRLACGLYRMRDITGDFVPAVSHQISRTRFRRLVGCPSGRGRRGTAQFSPKLTAELRTPDNYAHSRAINTNDQSQPTTLSTAG